MKGAEVFAVALENAFDFLSNEYQLLFEGSRASPFQHPLWLDRFYRKLAPACGAEPLIVTARRRSDRRLAMVLPLLRRRRHGLRIVEFADLEVTDYACPVCDDAAFGQLTRDSRTHERLRALLRPFDLVRIKKMPDHAQPIDRLLGARRASMSMSAHATRLSGSFVEWRTENMPRAFAKDLLKKRRQMARKGELKCERLHEPVAIASLFRDLRRFRGARFPGDVLGQPGHFAFYNDVAIAGASTGFARAYRMSLDGRSLGGIWGISRRRQFLVLISGLDYASHPRQSLGALAFEDVARDCIAQNDVLLDFTIGDESYKRSFGAEPSPLWMAAACGTGLGLLADWLTTQKKPPAVPAAPEPRAVAGAG